LNTVDVKEVQLRPLVVKYGVREAVKHCHEERSRVARLINLRVEQVILECLNAVGSSKGLLIVTALVTDVRQDVEGEFSQVECSWLLAMLDDVEQTLNQVLLLELDLEKIEVGSIQQGFHSSSSALVIFLVAQETCNDLVSIDLVNVLRDQRHEVSNDVESMDLQL
jgi:hypothetical protein